MAVQLTGRIAERVEGPTSLINLLVSMIRDNTMAVKETDKVEDSSSSQQN